MKNRKEILEKRIDKIQNKLFDLITKPQLSIEQEIFRIERKINNLSKKNINYKKIKEELTIKKKAIQKDGDSWIDLQIRLLSSLRDYLCIKTIYDMDYKKWIESLKLDNIDNQNK